MDSAQDERERGTSGTISGHESRRARVALRVACGPLRPSLYLSVADMTHSSGPPVPLRPQEWSLYTYLLSV